MIEIALVPISFGLIALIAWQQQQFGLREKEWAAERSQLINRIQHPEVVIPTGAMIAPAEIDAVLPSEPTDDIDLVGTVQTYGSDNSN